MDNALILATIIGPVYLLFGLSVLLYMKQWQKVCDEYAKNHLYLLPNMFLALVLGLIIVNMYNVWAWDLYVIITVTGWLLIIKAVFYLLAPGNWIKSILKCKCYSGAGWLYFWGIVMAVIGALLSYNAYFI